MFRLPCQMHAFDKLPIVATTEAIYKSSDITEFYNI